MPKLMTFGEAWEQLLIGNRIRRPAWPKFVYIWIEHLPFATGQMQHNLRKRYGEGEQNTAILQSISADDLMAEDWIVWDGKSTNP